MTDTAESLASTAPRKRSCRRYSLRALFVALLLISSAFGWVAYQARCLRAQYQWIQEVQGEHRLTLKPISNDWFWRRLVGDAAVTVKGAVFNGYSFERREYNLSLEDIEHIRTMSETERLSLAGPAITDQSIRFVAGLRELKVLGLENTGLTDAGTAYLANLDRLETLALFTNPERASVPGTSITEASLRNLVVGKDLRGLALSGITNDGLSTIVEHCPNLTSLQLIGSRIDGNGLAELQRLAKLWELSIWDNPYIDDASILQLTGAPALTKLWLKRTSVSKKGATALKAAMPGAFVHVEGGRPATLAN